MSNLLFQQLHLWFRRMCSMCRHHPCFVQIWQVFPIIRTTMLHNKQLDHCHQQHHHHQGEDLQRDIPCWRTCLCPCCGYPLGHCQGRQDVFRYGGLGYRLSMVLIWISANSQQKEKKDSDDLINRARWLHWLSPLPWLGNS